MGGEEEEGEGEWDGRKREGRERRGKEAGRERNGSRKVGPPRFQNRLTPLSAQGLEMVCMELTATCYVSGDNWSINYLVTKMDRYNKDQTKRYTHTHPLCTHNIWWLCCGMTTKKDHPRL